MFTAVRWNCLLFWIWSSSQYLIEDPLSNIWKCLKDHKKWVKAWFGEKNIGLGVKLWVKFLLCTIPVVKLWLMIVSSLSFNLFICNVETIILIRGVSFRRFLKCYMYSIKHSIAQKKKAFSYCYQYIYKCPTCVQGWFRWLTIRYTFIDRTVMPLTVLNKSGVLFLFYPYTLLVRIPILTMCRNLNTRDSRIRHSSFPQNSCNFQKLNLELFW